MYAVVEIGGHQYKVSEGDVLYVDRQKEESGNQITFDRVMLVNDGDGGVSVGQPVVSGATVTAELLDNVQADKVIVFKKKRRKGYQRKNGHRQPMSRIEIKGIDTSGSGGTKKSSKKEEAKAAPKETSKKENTASSGQQGQVSTDMSASDAIDHIKNTPVDQLEGFVTDSEDRVTVTRAWESKQEE